jgi:hypothetical protein
LEAQATPSPRHTFGVCRSQTIGEGFVAGGVEFVGMKVRARLVPEIFRKNEASEQTFGRLLEILGKLPSVIIEEKKTCVHVVAGKAAFLGVHPRKFGLRLTIKLDRRLPEAVKSDQASKLRFHNEVDVSLSAQADGAIRALDSTVAGWIEEAYRLELG